MVQKIDDGIEQNQRCQSDTQARDIADALLPKELSSTARHAVENAFRAYGHLTGLPDWSRYFTCSRSLSQQTAILRCDAEGYLEGLPPFLQLMYREYAEQATGTTDKSPELIRTWASKVLLRDVAPPPRDWKR